MKLHRRTLVAALVVALLGLVVTIGCASLPVVRNSLVYAKIASRLLDGSLGALELPRTAYGKGLAFPLLCVPFVKWLGPNAGVQGASFVTMLAFLGATLVFFERFGDRAGLATEHRWLAVVLVFVSPITFYQFWSGHADVLFATCFLVGIVAFDHMLEEKSPRAVALYMLAVFATMLSKNQGIVLPIAHAAFALFRLPDLRALLRKKSTYLPLVLPLVLMGVSIYLGRKGQNPLLPLNSNADEFAGTFASLWTFVLPNLTELLLFLLLGHSFVLVAFFRKEAWKKAVVPLYAVAATYSGILFLFHNTFYNLRYFFCISPILVVALLPVVLGFRAPLRRAVLGAALAFGLVATANFNAPPVYRALARVNAPLAASRYFDNLRMSAHLDAEKSIRAVNALPPSAKVVLVGDYYDDAAFGCYEKSGLLRSDLQVVAVKLAEERLPADAPVYLYLVQSTRPPTFAKRVKEKWGIVEWNALGGDVYEVKRITGAAGH